MGVRKRPPTPPCRWPERGGQGRWATDLAPREPPIRLPQGSGPRALPVLLGLSPTRRPTAQVWQVTTAAAWKSLRLQATWTSAPWAPRGQGRQCSQCWRLRTGSGLLRTLLWSTAPPGWARPQPCPLHPPWPGAGRPLPLSKAGTQDPPWPPGVIRGTWCCCRERELQQGTFPSPPCLAECIPAGASFVSSKTSVCRQF